MYKRQVGYGVEQLFRRVRHVLTVQGVFGKVRVAIGGMAVTTELAQSLGFEAGYGPHTSIEEIHALIERNPELARHITHPVKHKPAFPFPHDNTVKDPTTLKYLNQIVDGILEWTANKTSPGVARAQITEAQLQEVKGSVESYTALPFTRDYLGQCDEAVVDFSKKTSARRASGRSRNRKWTPAFIALTSRRRISIRAFSSTVAPSRSCSSNTAPAVR